MAVPAEAAGGAAVKKEDGTACGKRWEKILRKKKKKKKKKLTTQMWCGLFLSHHIQDLSLSTLARTWWAVGRVLGDGEAVGAA